MHPTEYKIVTSKDFSCHLALGGDLIVDLLVTCQDHGRPPLSTQEPLVVKVVASATANFSAGDHHDSHGAVLEQMLLAFSEDVYHAQIEENNKIGAVLKQLKLVSRPAQGVNASAKWPHHNNGAGMRSKLAGQHRYAIKKEETAFENVLDIDSTSGVITALVSFDRENRSVYEFEIHAVMTDAGPRQAPQFQGQQKHTAGRAVQSTEVVAKTKLKLNILDVDDERPHFTKPTYYFLLSELQSGQIGAFVGIVRAVDKDSASHARLTYRLEPLGFESSQIHTAASRPIHHNVLPFKIDQTSGIISLFRPLTVEDTDAPYLFLAVASSSYRGKPAETSATVTVEVSAKKWNSYRSETSRDNPEAQSKTRLDLSSLQQTTSQAGEKLATVYLASETKAGDELLRLNVRREQLNFQLPQKNLEFKLIQQHEGDRLKRLKTPADSFEIDPKSGVIRASVDASSLSADFDVILHVMLFETSAIPDHTDLKDKQHAEVQSRQHLPSHQASHLLDTAPIRVVYRRNVADGSYMSAQNVYRLLASERLAVILSVTLVAIFAAITSLLVIICFARLRKQRQTANADKELSLYERSNTINNNGMVKEEFQNANEGCLDEVLTCPDDSANSTNGLLSVKSREMVAFGYNSKLHIKSFT